MLRGFLGFILAICAFAPAASCVSPEELRRQDEATCAGYGFHPGTDAFAVSSGRAWRAVIRFRRHFRIGAGVIGASPGGRIGLSERL